MCLQQTIIAHTPAPLDALAGACSHNPFLLKSVEIEIEIGRIGFVGIVLVLGAYQRGFPSDPPLIRSEREEEGKWESGKEGTALLCKRH